MVQINNQLLHWPSLFAMADCCRDVYRIKYQLPQLSARNNLVSQKDHNWMDKTEGKCTNIEIGKIYVNIWGC